ncbi:MAG: histidine phosphatase family protein [bacterium]|nr:histidine phosphatase family protein [bacterium]
MKYIYFVRHGTTVGNEANEFQLPTIPLSEKGLEEASFLSERFESIPIEVIFSSTMKRALQTAEIIGSHLGQSVTGSELFEEIKRPSFVRGKSKSDPEVKSTMREVKAHFTDPNWRHSDEENFYFAKERAQRALAFILDRKEESILVVTHGEILRMMLSIIVFGDEVTPEIYDGMKKSFIPFNTGISKIEYDKEIGDKESGWYVLTWNDHAHLGEVT